MTKISMYSSAMEDNQWTALESWAPKTHWCRWGAEASASGPITQRSYSIVDQFVKKLNAVHDRTVSEDTVHCRMRGCVAADWSECPWWKLGFWHSCGCYSTLTCTVPKDCCRQCTLAQEQFEEHDKVFKVLPCPLNSPALNPFEHLQYRMYRTNKSDLWRPHLPTCRT